MPQLGTIGCITPGCGGTAAVSQTASGVVNVKCPHCTCSAHYGTGSSGAKKVIRATTPVADDDEPAPATKPGFSPLTPAAKKPAHLWDRG